MRNLIFTNIYEVVTGSGWVKKQGRMPTEADLGVIAKAAIVCVQGRIAWVGPEKQLTAKIRRDLFGKAKPKEVNLAGATVLPAFSECHTHLLFAGNRRNEMDLRAQGVSYQEIAAQGGGIRSTMKATRAATSAELLKLGQARVNRFLRQGVTTIESKTGYGLDEKTEIKLLQVNLKLKGARIIGTFLGPHALPPEFATHDHYLEHLLADVLPKIDKQKLAQRVDMFVERGFFTAKHAQAWFSAAEKLGLKGVLHVDQLSPQGGAKLAAQLKLQSIDHAVHATDSDITELAKLNTTAVLLPTADFYLQEKYPRARAMLAAGVRVALATDYNPGTSPSQDLSLVGVLARVEMKMTLPEVLAAYIYGSVAALGMENDLGSLTNGRFCDLAVIDGSWRDLFSEVGLHPVTSTWREGERLTDFASI